MVSCRNCLGPRLCTIDSRIRHNDGPATTLCAPSPHYKCSPCTERLSERPLLLLLPAHHDHERRSRPRRRRPRLSARPKDARSTECRRSMESRSGLQGLQPRTVRQIRLDTASDIRRAAKPPKRVFDCKPSPLARNTDISDRHQPRGTPNMAPTRL